jgi:hemolysin activation/secretion protein
VNQHQRLSLIAVALGLCLANTRVWAQTAEAEIGAMQQLEREQSIRLRQEWRLQQRPTPPGIDLPEAPPRSAASQVRNIPVQHFDVEPSAILDANEIQSVLAPFTNRTLSLDDLFDAVAAVNSLYDQRQMPTARAVLPPQHIRDGAVSIRLVEARVGQVLVQSSNQVTPAFVRERLHLQEGALLLTSELEIDLVRFNRLHRAQLRASVRPGPSTGTTDVELLSQEPQPQHFSLFTDNAGRSTVGTLRTGFLAQWNGLGGRDDTLQIASVGAQGSQSLHATYATPLNVDDLRLDVSYNNDRIKVISGGFTPLDIGGTSNTLSFGLSRPFIVESQRLWRGYMRISDKTSRSTFGGILQQKTDLAVLTLGLSADHFGETSNRTVDINFSQGIKDFGGDARFTVLRANSANLATLLPGTQLLLRGGLQYSSTDLLPSSEQFQLGGSASVRGYSEGLLTGRSGYLLSAEVRQLLNQPDGSLTGVPYLTGLVFFDHGGAFPFRPSPINDITRNDFLSSTGVGLAAEWVSGVQGRLTLGWPMRNNTNELEGREPRLHATLTINWH